MRKRLVPLHDEIRRPPEPAWLDLEPRAAVEVTSEDPAHPIEAALLPGPGGRTTGWRAGEPGSQTVRVLFDSPQGVHRIRVHVVEAAIERTQEFVVRWSADGGRSFREVVRQQWHFSPRGSTDQLEDYRVDLAGVTVLELAITPDVGNADAVASLMELRLA